MSSKDYVTYGQAKELRQLGFNEPCLYNYDAAGNFVPNSAVGYEEESITTEDLLESHNFWEHERVDAPTLSQVQKWLMEKKELWVFSNRVKQKELKGKFYWSISDKDLNEFTTESFKLFNSYEEALSEGITECLKLLNN